MDFITNLFGSLNYEAIAQIALVSLIMISGPVVIVILAFRGGDI